MKRPPSILPLVPLILLFCAATALSNDVYVYKLDGNHLYLLPQGQSNTEKQTLRIMELIPINSILEIGENTTAYITCPDCEVVKLTRVDSPFSVSEQVIKRQNSKSKILISHFTAALKEFIYPDSKAGKRVYMNVRGTQIPQSQDTCDTLFPQDYEDIMIMGDHITFKWRKEGKDFVFKLYNSSNDQLIEEAETQEAFLNVPFVRLKSGFVYHWTVTEKNTGKACQASFSILSEQDTRETKKNLEEIARLLPGDADQETRVRLQSGYLLSEGFIFNAFRLLETNGF